MFGRELIMAFFEQHCAEAMKKIGKSYAEVHRWLDEFAGYPPYGMCPGKNSSPEGRD
jgi:hypothetical protein